MVLKYIRFKRKSGVSTGSTFSALTVKREIQKKTAFDPGIPLLFESTQFQLDFRRVINVTWMSTDLAHNWMWCATRLSKIYDLFMLRFRDIDWVTTDVLTWKRFLLLGIPKCRSPSSFKDFRWLGIMDQLCKLFAGTVYTPIRR